jgi:integrase
VGNVAKRLNDKTARELTEPGRYRADDGLYLEVRRTKAGTLSRSWTLRFQLNDKRRDMGLGSYPTVTLTEARKKANEARVLIARGSDPLATRETARRAAERAEKPIPTFREIAKLVIADAQARSTNAKVRYQWGRHLGAAYCAPLLDRPANEITTIDVAAVLRPIWRTKPEVARKTYPAIRRVFDRARIILRDEHGIEMSRNPADWRDLKAMGFEAPRQLSRGRQPSLAYAQMPDFMVDLRSREGIAARALEFLTLTGVRTDAVLKARWDQFDLDQAVWTVPLSSLKDRAHRSEGFRVPLAARAVELIREMAAASTSEFVFPGQRAGKPLSNMAMLILLRRMNAGSEPRWIDPASGKPITAHGFRATFKTWAEESATFFHAIVEMALGHTVGNAVERAYRRTDLLDQRRGLMEAWARHCEPREIGDATVIPLRRA